MEHKLQQELTALDDTIQSTRLIPKRVRDALHAEIVQTNQSVTQFFDVRLSPGSCHLSFDPFFAALVLTLTSSCSICLRFSTSRRCQKSSSNSLCATRPVVCHHFGKRVLLLPVRHHLLLLLLCLLIIYLTSLYALKQGSGG